MYFPSQRVQIDVKFVPGACLVWDVKGKKFYQYAAIDEYSIFRYLESFEEHSTHSSTLLLEHLIEKFPVPIHCIQADNGAEFTKAITEQKSHSHSYPSIYANTQWKDRKIPS